jgi:hypothetical protein
MHETRIGNSNQRTLHHEYITRLLSSEQQAASVEVMAVTAGSLIRVPFSSPILVDDAKGPVCPALSSWIET